MVPIAFDSSWLGTEKPSELSRTIFGRLLPLVVSGSESYSSQATDKASQGSMSAIRVEAVSFGL